MCGQREPSYTRGKSYLSTSSLSFWESIERAPMGKRAERRLGNFRLLATRSRLSLLLHRLEGQSRTPFTRPTSKDWNQWKDITRAVLSARTAVNMGAVHR